MAQFFVFVVQMRKDWLLWILRLNTKAETIGLILNELFNSFLHGAFTFIFSPRYK